MGVTSDGRMSGDNLYLEFMSIPLRVSSKGVDIAHSQKSSDGTVLNDNYETTIPGKKNLKISGDFVVFTKATEGAAQRATLKLGNQGTFLWGPEGNAAGLPKGGADMRIVKSDQKYKVGETAIFAVEWEISDGTDLLFDDAVDVWS